MFFRPSKNDIFQEKEEVFDKFEKFKVQKGDILKMRPKTSDFDVKKQTFQQKRNLGSEKWEIERNNSQKS